MPDRKKQTVLIIEDTEDNMVLITKLLQNGGYDTLTSYSGLQGIQLAIEKEPDFIILDIQLPDIEGTEVVPRIRALNSDIATVPIIAMTSYAMAGDREKLLAAGCNGYIEKPIDPMRVLDQIKQIIEGS